MGSLGETSVRAALVVAVLARGVPSPGPMLIECKNCGAPLDIKEGKRTVKCAYCRSTNAVQQTRMLAQVTPPRWSAPKVWMPPPNVAAPKTQLKYHGGGFGCGLTVFILLVTLVPTGIGIAAATGGTGWVKVWRWDKTSTLECGVNEELELSDVEATVDGGPVIKVVGPNCTVRIKDSKLSGDVGVQVEAVNFKLYLLNSTVEGTSNGIECGTNCDIYAEQNSSIKGGEIGVQHANTIKLQDSKISGTRAAIEAENNLDLQLEGSEVMGAKTAVTAGVSLKIAVDKDSKINATTAVVAGTGANITVRDGTIEATSSAIRLTGSNLVLQVLADGKVTSKDAIVSGATNNPKLTVEGGLIQAGGTVIEGKHNMNLTINEGGRVKGATGVVFNSGGHVTINNGTLEVSGTAIDVANNATVDCRGGTIKAKEAFKFDSNATVKLNGCKVTGTRSLGKRAKVDEK